MFAKHNNVRDAFAFSLGGMTAITSFTAAPAIADDRINQVLDAQRAEKRRKGNVDRTTGCEQLADCTNL